VDGVDAGVADGLADEAPGVGVAPREHVHHPHRVGLLEEPRLARIGGGDPQRLGHQRGGLELGLTAVDPLVELADPHEHGQPGVEGGDVAHVTIIGRSLTAGSSRRPPGVPSDFYVHLLRARWAAATFGWSNASGLVPVASALAMPGGKVGCSVEHGETCSAVRTASPRVTMRIGS
jgi:hypothetical protein